MKYPVLKFIRLTKKIILLSLIMVLVSPATARRTDFTSQWRFQLTDSSTNASAVNYPDQNWRVLHLPHDWSIESDFSDQFPATPGGGALPGGLGWYRKTFTLNQSEKGKLFYIDFDGVYRNSEVWINGHFLGKRPNGYISFRYDLTPYLLFNQPNVIAVKVDNSKQPNSRWYSGAGIFRNVWLVCTSDVHVDQWGTYITTPQVSDQRAVVAIETTVKNTSKTPKTVKVQQILINALGKEVARGEHTITVTPESSGKLNQSLNVMNPIRWSLEKPYLYTLQTRLWVAGKLMDDYKTPTGIRTFAFDPVTGFTLNGKSVKINGVCNHHDLGALGAAVNKRAIQRQLEILKAMGCNGIRTSHNPPAPELLELCDEMGFVVMDEAFDIWKKRKSTYDYSLDFDQWYERDLTDQLLRDRNHPSVFIWSIGNEVGEQWADANTEGLDLQQANIALNNKKEIRPEDYQSLKVKAQAELTRHLAEIVRKTDPTRPITAACNETGSQNPLFTSNALDMIGFNYHEADFAGVTKRYPDKSFIVTESVSSLHTRGFYLMPSDSMNIWPERWDIPFKNPLQKCSAYDNSHAPWGSTHETTWKLVKKYPHISGQYIWTGFDYLGEPTPYWWPSRSSYFGIVDLAGFPKDVYYMYQSEWTTKNVLHIFPHWNWVAGQPVDIWAYYNNADEVELYLNGVSVGKRSKKGDELHVMWRIPFIPGTLKAISRKNGVEVMSSQVQTAGRAVAIRLKADRNTITADGKDLAFVNVELVDKNGVALPLANQLVKFSLEGDGSIAGTDNGDQNDHISLKKPERHLFYGKCLAIVQGGTKAGSLVLKAEVEGLPEARLQITQK